MPDLVSTQNQKHTDNGDKEPHCNKSCSDWWYLPNIYGIEKAAVAIKKPILIAIIDDGFRLTHQDIAPFVYKNPLEKANGLDDDGNGYIDDIAGWDMSDQDANVSFPPNRRDEFYHGTYISGIITKLLTAVYGNNASDYFKIVPIKALSDFAGYTYIKDGYTAMDYAAKIQADIVCTAWGANVVKPEEKEAVAKLQAQGICLLASAGNFSNSMEQFPAALNGVIAIAALNRNDEKIDLSNFGRFIDLSAAGIDVCGASVYGDNQYLSCKGTSPAVAIASAMAAIIKLHQPNASTDEIEAILKATSTPIEQYNESYAGRLGAGKVNLNKLLNQLNSGVTTEASINPQHPQGLIKLNGNGKVPLTWNIMPMGDYKGIEFTMEQASGNIKNAAIHFATPVGLDTSLLLKNWTVGSSFFVQGNLASLQFNPKSAPKNLSAKISYAVVPIDSTILYCSGIKYLFDEQGTIEDGSGLGNYANSADCKWQIEVPEGKNIYLKFLELDTEINIDQVMIFKGTSTIPENMLARQSGSIIPPAFNTQANRVLIWFVTDGQNTAKGWKIAYTVK